MRIRSLSATVSISRGLSLLVTPEVEIFIESPYPGQGKLHWAGAGRAFMGTSDITMI